MGIVNFDPFYQQIDNSTDKIRQDNERRKQLIIKMGEQAKVWDAQLNDLYESQQAQEKTALEAAYQLDSEADNRISELERTIEQNQQQLEDLRNYANSALDEFN